MKKKDVIIIGAGPAGISASLYTLRANLKTTIVTNGNSALLSAEKIENYYGFSQPISGKQLYENGIENAKRLGGNFIFSEVLGINYDFNENQFILETTDEKLCSKALLIATGAQRKKPDIKGVSRLEGKGISYCAICDAFFYRKKDVVVIGNGNFALHEAMTLSSTASSVTILTDGKEADFKTPDNGINVNSNPITEIIGSDKVEGVSFSDGTLISTNGVFIALGVAGSGDFAKKIGAVTENNRIVTDENMMTNIPLLYAAGDCTGGLYQISKAVYEGAKAGTEIIKKLKAQK